MTKYLFFLIFVFPLKFFNSQNLVSGQIFNDSKVALSGVLVVNINTNEKTGSDQNGYFSIRAKENDELRFVRLNYERASTIIKSENFYIPIRILMVYDAELIETVDVSFLPSGDLGKDSSQLNKVDKVAQLEKNIGLPKNPEKPREVPSKVGRNILLPIVFGKLDVQAIYNVLSGKARRQKRLYKYQDFQEKVDWIKNNLKEDFFKENQIPNNQILDFIGFALNTNSTIGQGFKQKNIDKISFALIQMAPEYLKRKNRK